MSIISYSEFAHVLILSYNLKIRVKDTVSK